jgi:hypothetical protein
MDCLKRVIFLTETNVSVPVTVFRLTLGTNQPLSSPYWEISVVTWPEREANRCLLLVPKSET